MAAIQSVTSESLFAKNNAKYAAPENIADIDKYWRS